MGWRGSILGIALLALAPRVAAAQTPPPVPEDYGQTEARPERADHVRVDALSWGERPLTLHVIDEPVGPCTAPCRLELSPGRYRLAVQPRGGGPRDADGDPLLLQEGRVAVQMTYDHRIGLRSLGWVFVCFALSALGATAPFFGVGTANVFTIVGVPIAAGFLIPAVPLIFLEDSARVEITPLPPPGGPR